MWQVMKEVFTAEGEQISREIQADHIPEWEAVEIAATCTRLEQEAPSHDDGRSVVYAVQFAPGSF